MDGGPVRSCMARIHRTASLRYFFVCWAMLARLKLNAFDQYQSVGLNPNETFVFNPCTAHTFLRSADGMHSSRKRQPPHIRYPEAYIGQVATRRGCPQTRGPGLVTCEMKHISGMMEEKIRLCCCCPVLHSQCER